MRAHISCYSYRFMYYILKCKLYIQSLRTASESRYYRCRLDTPKKSCIYELYIYIPIYEIWNVAECYIEFEMILHRRSQYKNNIVFQYFDLIKLDVTLIIIDDTKFYTKQPLFLCLGKLLVNSKRGNWLCEFKESLFLHFYIYIYIYIYMCSPHS